MKIIKPSASIMEHNLTPYEFIEKVGRTCYKSEDKITKGSAEKFVANLVKRNHWAMLEHETLYLGMSDDFILRFLDDTIENLEDLKFFNISTEKGCNIISGSFRSFHDFFEEVYESDTIKFLKNGLHSIYPSVFGEPLWCECPSFKEMDVVLYTRENFIEKFKDHEGILFKHLTHTVKFVCDRGVSHEFVRHRVASFAQESTRYCNYSKDKFGKEITFIEPPFFGEKTSDRYCNWEYAMDMAETCYFDLLDMGATPQEARTVLPNSLKTELIITATEEEWQHIVNLRYLGTTGSPHPQMKEVMELIVDDLENESDDRIKKVM